MLHSDYQVVNGTFYHRDTPAAVINALEHARKAGTRIRLRYGDTESGRDWLDEFDVEGQIGRSMGPVKVPILLARSTSSGGPALLENCIVKIRQTGKDGRTLFRHPKYHTPALVVRSSSEFGYETEVLSDGAVHARFRTAVQAHRWMRKMTT